MVIMISPLMSIVEDLVSYARSLGIQAAYLGESITKDRGNIEWIGSVFFVVRKPGIINWGTRNSGQCSLRSSTRRIRLQVQTTVH